MAMNKYAEVREIPYDRIRIEDFNNIAKDYRYFEIIEDFQYHVDTGSEK